MLNKIRLFTLLLILFSGLLKAQDNCSDALYQANKLYELGNLKECVDRLEPCLNKKMSDAELEASYHLLAMAYFTLNNTEKLDYYIKKLLHLKPDYSNYPNIDPIDFSRKIEEYKVVPQLNIGLLFGFNISTINLNKSYSLYPSTQRYLPTIGYQFGLATTYQVWKSIGIQSNFMISHFTINHIIDDAGGWKQDYQEQQNYLSLNLAAINQMKINKTMGWYTGIGTSLNYLSQANVSIEATNNETEIIQQSSQNATKFRNKFQPAVLLVSGITMPIAKGHLGVDLGYSFYIKNTVNKLERLTDTNFIFNNQYLNDDIKLKTFMFNISYKFPVLWKIQKKTT